MGNSDQGKISYFEPDIISGITLPERFTFPFFYEPHPLTIIAAAELKHYLETHKGLNHNFGLTPDTAQGAIGKMFGVLVVQDDAGRLGYLSAFSGKLDGSNDHPRFVPPVFDMLVEDGFFLKEQEVISGVNTQLEALETDEQYLQLRQEQAQVSVRSAAEIKACKEQLKANKEIRHQRREAARAHADAPTYAQLEADLVRESLRDKFLLRELTLKWKQQAEDIAARLAQTEARIEALKNERRERSAALQGQLFDQYVFLNKDLVSKSLHDIFSATVFGRPPSAAGECATPKLLQYAFAHGHKPLAMAEFWWGASPKSEIRKHGQFYPACTGKCKPILAHMLEGIALDDNPFLLPAADNDPLEVVYEDDCLLVVNKPSGLRSVPGVNVYESVYSKLKLALGHTEPFIVHRLDMGTSGLLVVAKTPGAHKHLQRQFLNRTVSKRYTALLSRPIDEDQGEIALPLIPDLYNRPRQLVCFTTGKKSITRWQVVSRTDTVTKIHFWPLTGRTHQLRMHSAHELGLNAPIIGDDLYGTPAGRLYLHAAQIAFIHPVTKERLSFEVAEDF